MDKTQPIKEPTRRRSDRGPEGTEGWMYTVATVIVALISLATVPILTERQGSVHAHMQLLTFLVSLWFFLAAWTIAPFHAQTKRVTQRSAANVSGFVIVCGLCLGWMEHFLVPSKPDGLGIAVGAATGLAFWCYIRSYVRGSKSIAGLGTLLALPAFTVATTVWVGPGLFTISLDKTVYRELDQATVTLTGWTGIPPGTQRFDVAPVSYLEPNESVVGAAARLSKKAVLDQAEASLTRDQAYATFIAGEIGGLRCTQNVCEEPSYPYFGTFQITAHVYHPWVAGQSLSIPGPVFTVLPRADIEKNRQDVQRSQKLYETICTEAEKLMTQLTEEERKDQGYKCGGFDLVLEEYTPDGLAEQDAHLFLDRFIRPTTLSWNADGTQVCLELMANDHTEGRARACQDTANAPSDIDVEFIGWKSPGFHVGSVNRSLENALSRHTEQHKDVFHAYGMDRTNVWGQDNGSWWPSIPRDVQPKELWRKETGGWRTRQHVNGHPLDALMREDGTFCLVFLDRHLLEAPRNGCDIDTRDGTTVTGPQSNTRPVVPGWHWEIVSSKDEALRMESHGPDHVAILPIQRTGLPHQEPWREKPHMVVHWGKDGAASIRYILPSNIEAHLAPSAVFTEVANTCTADRVRACWIDIAMSPAWEGPLVGEIRLNRGEAKRSLLFTIQPRANPSVERSFVYLGTPTPHLEPWPAGGYVATLALRNTGTTPRQLALHPQPNEVIESPVHLLDRTCQEGIVQPGEVCTQRVYVQTPAWLPVRYTPAGLGLDLGLAAQGLLFLPKDNALENPLVGMRAPGDVCPANGEKATIWQDTHLVDIWDSDNRKGEKLRIRTQTCAWRSTFEASGMEILVCDGQVTYETLRIQNDAEMNGDCEEGAVCQPPDPQPMDNFLYYDDRVPKREDHSAPMERRGNLVEPQPGMEHPFSSTLSAPFTLEHASTVDSRRTANPPLYCHQGRVHNGWLSNQTPMEDSP
jgi:hypothetical protein